MKKFLKKASSETAKEALDRYQSFLDAIEQDELYSSYELHYTHQPVPIVTVKKTEQRLGIKLPPSYTDFITTYGLFEIGDKEEYPQLCFELLEAVDKPIVEMMLIIG